MRFSKEVAVPQEIPPLDGLEPTLLPGAAGGAEPVLAEWVEPTGFAGAEGAEAVPVPDIEPTRLAGSEPPSSLEMLPEGGAAPDWFDPTPVGVPDVEPAEPAPLVCRYCRTPANPGQVMCNRCGMRLPVWRSPEAEVQPTELCTDCGTPVQGTICKACGARRRSPG